MSIAVGDSLPAATFRIMTDDGPAARSTEEIFKGRKVVLFAVPGAFTPTCSSFQIPGYEKEYETIKSLGVDEVYCLSVNDAFVMRQWGLSQGMEEDKTIGANGFKKVKLLPDGACLFTRVARLELDWPRPTRFGSSAQGR
jgi:peroxiredoxin